MVNRIFQDVKKNYNNSNDQQGNFLMLLLKLMQAKNTIRRIINLKLIFFMSRKAQKIYHFN
jgi:hypothetical protein